MTVKNQTGNEYLAQLASDVAELPLGQYLSLGTLADENWSSLSYDDNAQNKSGTFSSAEGSKITFNSQDTRSTAFDTSKGSVLVFGKTNGTQLSTSWSDKWSEFESSEIKNISWSYTGGTSTKEDDFNYKLSSSPSSKWESTPSGHTGTYTDKGSLQIENAQYAYNFSWMGSGQYVWDAAVQENISDLYSGSGYIKFSDKSNGITFSFSAQQTQDRSANQDKWVFTSAKYETPDISVTTGNFTKITTFEGFTELGRISHDVGDLSLISSNVPILHEIFAPASSSITIKSTSGVDIDAGAGNDKVIGGKGDDTISAGAGKDILTGGSGNDTFILNFSDYDFSSATAVLANTITDFKFSASQTDTLLLNGFDEVAVFKTLADAKKISSDATVIYESAKGKFWYNADGDAGLVGAVNFAMVKGIPDAYWNS